MTTQLTGRCLCGGVTFALPISHGNVGACHCSMCRRWAGAPSMVVEFAGPVAFGGGELIGCYRSSEFVERLFCSRCGSVLGTKLPNEDHYWLSAGAISETDNLTFTEEVFIDEKPGYYAFANETRKVTGPEFQAAWETQIKKD